MGSVNDRPLILELPSDCLSKIFSKLALEERRSLRYVCKSWAKQLKASGALYEELQLHLADASSYLPSGVAEMMYVVAEEFRRWVTPRAPFARHLNLTLSPLEDDIAFTSYAMTSIVNACHSSKRLERLELSMPGRLWLPPQLGRLSHLRVLVLRADCTVTPLPGWLSALEALEELHIDVEIAGGYRVAEHFLPLQLLSLVRLRRLCLEHCHTVCIPLCVGELCSLQALVIKDCSKLLFHVGVFMQNTFATISLEILTLAGCNLKLVPYQIMGIGSLRELDLSDNQLAVLPATFSVRLKSLKRLVLRNNSFTRLPRLLARLPALEHLDLSFNDKLQVHESEEDSGEAGQRQPWEGGRLRVHTITSILGLLSRLEHLDLRQRPRKQWHPASLRELKCLRGMAASAMAGSSPDPACSLKTLLL